MRRSMLALPLLVGACVQQPELVAPAREPLLVEAPFETTWNAIIDHFAERNLPIANMDKASGFIATAELPIHEVHYEWADCGIVMGIRQPPNGATYNVVARPQGETRTTLKITTLWEVHTEGLRCVSKGRWEQEAEAAIAEAAVRARAK